MGAGLWEQVCRSRFVGADLWEQVCRSRSMFGAQRVPRVFVPDSSWVMVCRVLSVGDCGLDEYDLELMFESLLQGLFGLASVAMQTCFDSTELRHCRESMLVA